MTSLKAIQTVTVQEASLDSTKPGLHLIAERLF